ncbi:hypothetical protein MMC17_005519 [Xylographa soralifera]|nr:hypothetical protein [Xylographa soralifera]
MEAEVQTTSTPPQKFSRYRSVRIAALKEAPAPSVPAFPSHIADEGVRREPSRYKHKRPTSGLPGLSQDAGPSHREISPLNAFGLKGEGLQSLEETITPDSDRTRLSDTQNGIGSTNCSRALPTNRDEDREKRRLAGRAAAFPLIQPSAAQYQDLDLSQGPVESIAGKGFNDAHRETYAILNGEVNRERKLRQARRDNGQQTNQSARYQKGEKVNHQWPTAEEKMGQTKDLPRGLSTAHTGANVAAQKPNQAPFSAPENRSLQRNLPGIDAPVSAVNTGERNVRVKFNKSSIAVPVTTATTVDDVLHFAAESFPKSFDANSAVLLESFKPLGLERPLRRSEHVRDVLNSWDHDTQNSLLVVQSFMELGGNSLGTASVPAKQPEAASVSIYHSQKPGTWDKRQITLREDGQIILAKSSGETTNICHMSDFDLYTPTHRQLKKLDPPKKLCFAIKSQQKSAMFLTTANFVHFFSTKDKVVAQTWYKAVQNWRSWYLVRVLGNGQKQLIPQPTLTHSVDKVSGVERTVKHERRASQKFPSRPIYTPIPAETMKGIAIDSYTKPAIVPPALDPIETTLRMRPLRNHAGPPVSFPKHFATISDTEPLARLIKATSSQSLQTQGETAVFSGQHGKQPSQRFGVPHTQSPRTSPQKQSNELVRSTSQRHKPAQLVRPLVDLTPQFQEAPQYLRKGRGITISQIPVGGLVNIATSPEVAVPLPPTAILQRSGTGYKNETGMQRTMTTRAPAPHATSPLPSPEKQEVAFLMGGLLAQADIRREGRKSSTGAKTGDRDGKEPMLDVVESSIYVPGSLLAGVEKEAGSTGPRIDREKKTEVITSTGECL